MTIVLIGMILVLCGGLYSRMRYEATLCQVLEHKCYISNSSQPLTLFFISDIHFRTLSTDWIETIAEQKVDYVIIGGDLAERHVPEQQVVQNLQQLRQIAPVFYVYGNNDREIGEERLNRILFEQNVHVLQNNSVCLIHHRGWMICGTDDPSTRRANVYETLASCSDTMETIFVSHSPVFFEKADELAKISLKLAGHTHGGQIRLGPFGLHERGSFQVNDGRATLVSNGYGTTKIPLRLGAPAETHIVKMQRMIEEDLQ